MLHETFSLRKGCNQHVRKNSMRFFTLQITVNSKYPWKDNLHSMVWYVSFNELFVMVSQTNGSAEPRSVLSK